MTYSFESTGSRKPLHAMVVGTLAAAVLLFSISNREGIPMPHLFQAGAIVCLTATVYLLVRYSLKLYRYAVEPNGILDAMGMEQYDLIITEIVGKKMTVVARVALRDVDKAAVTILVRSDKTASAAREALCSGRQVFRYENTPVSPRSCYIPLAEENSVVVIPADERMAAILKGDRLWPGEA